jgi:hypothetical protein
VKPILSFARSAALAVALLAAANGASAQTAGSSPCTTDMKSLCPDAQGAAGRYRCLLEHEAELSTTCRDHLRTQQAQRAARRAAVRSACQADIDRWCALATPSEGGVFGCLRRKADEVSPACREALSRRGNAAP